MHILSFTFHSEEQSVENWKIYMEDYLIKSLENLENIKDFFLSKVENEMIHEGENFNLLLFFDSENSSKDFLEKDFTKLFGEIENEFENKVLIFRTELKKIKTSL